MKVKKIRLIKTAMVRSSKQSMTSSKKFLIRLWMMPTLDLSISRNLIQLTKENKMMMISLTKLEFRIDST